MWAEGHRSNRAAIHRFHRFIHTPEDRRITTVHRKCDQRNLAVDDTPVSRAGPGDGAAAEERTAENLGEDRIACESQRDTPRAPAAPMTRAMITAGAVTHFTGHAGGW